MFGFGFLIILCIVSRQLSAGGDGFSVQRLKMEKRGEEEVLA